MAGPPNLSLSAGSFHLPPHYRPDPPGRPGHLSPFDGLQSPGPRVLAKSPVLGRLNTRSFHTPPSSPDLSVPLAWHLEVSLTGHRATTQKPQQSPCGPLAALDMTIKSFTWVPLPLSSWEKPPFSPRALYSPWSVPQTLGPRTAVLRWVSVGSTLLTIIHNPACSTLYHHPWPPVRGFWGLFLPYSPSLVTHSWTSAPSYT